MAGIGDHEGATAVPRRRHDKPGPRPSQRVVGGAAWAVPVLAVGAPASTHAADVEPAVTVGLWVSCGHNPSSGVAHMHVELVVTNTLGDSVVVTLTDVSLLPVNGDAVTFPKPPPVVVAERASTCVVLDCVVLDSDGPGDGSGSTLVVQYEWTTSTGTDSSMAALAGGALPACQSQGVPDYPHTGYTC